MIGASGVRGIVGEDLSPELVARFGAAFGEFLGDGLVAVACRGFGDLSHAVSSAHGKAS